MVISAPVVAKFENKILKEIIVIDLGVVNFHFTHKCNYECKFCYSHFFASKEKEILDFHKWKQIANLLKPYCKRINFAGGEPLLHKKLIGELLEHNQKIDLISTIITNGYLLDEQWLNQYGKYLKAIGISCDSSKEIVNRKLGRGIGNHVENTIEKLQMIKNFNKIDGDILPKLNTVINKLNYKENMVDFVLKTGVKRWKVFQLLTIEGENEQYSEELVINKEKFEIFCHQNKEIEQYGIEFIPEDVDELTNTYIMIDPEGRFFSNNNNKYIFSEPIYEVGVEEALNQINFKQQNLENINRMFI